MKRRMLGKKILPGTMAGLMVLTLIPATAFAANGNAENAEVVINGKTYTYAAVDYNEDGVADAYEIHGVRYCDNILSEDYQYMNIFIPAAYVNADGTINETAIVNGYTSETAPIIYRNHCHGWNSSDPEYNKETYGYGGGEADDFIGEGFIYVSAGARSRNLGTIGKAPAPVVDLKAGIITLRANEDVLPGDTDKIISVGGSGAGEMSTMLGASGNMEEYYSYLYEIKAPGVTYDAATGTYASEYADDIYGCMAFYPIADIDNADLAYAWMRVNSGETELAKKNSTIKFTDFQLELQKDEAYAFIDYINGLNLKDEDGKALVLTGLRSGSYYDKVLGNLSDALEAYLAELSQEEADAYMTKVLATNDTANPWIVKSGDGYQVVDLDGFIKNAGNNGDDSTLGEVFKRNKNIPGFDTLDLSAENNAFGPTTMDKVHYSSTVAAVLKNNYEKYLGLMTDTEKEQVELYIEQAYLGTGATDLAKATDAQTYLMNAMEIMLASADGKEETDVAPQWRVRTGTADQHTAFTVGYNVAVAADLAGSDVDYSMVWKMIHGSEMEGTSTGTFIEWVNDICAVDDSTNNGPTDDDSQAPGTDTQKPSGDTQKPSGDTQKPSTDSGKESPKTGAASGMLPMVIASIAAVAGASVRGRKLR